MTTSLRELADTAYASYYRDIADIRSYLIAELMMHPDDELTTANMIDSLDTDIRDLISNANLCDLIPDAADLDDAAYDELARRIRDDARFPALIARRILLDNARPITHN